MEEDERSVTPIRSQAERDHSQSVSSSHLKKNPYCKFYEDSDSRQGTLMKVEFKSVSDSCIKELFGEDKAEREDQNEINKQKWEEDII